MADLEHPPGSGGGRGSLLRRWWADELGGPGRMLHLLAWPAEGLFRVGAAFRERAYRWGLLRVERGPIPVVSVGNLVVGGTGKTPVAGWLVGRLRARGRSPALVTRGYGTDEVALHGRWHPEVPVWVAERRVDGVRRAAENGADVAVVDDGFQHRRLHRDLDLVLLSAEEPLRGRRLPRGPFREPPWALGRAHVIVVTRRTAGEAQARALAQEAAELAPQATMVRLRLEPGDWTDLHGEIREAPGAEEGRRGVLAVCSIARADPFARTVRDLLESEVELMEFPDHHDYAAVDARRIAERARGRSVVTTEKDAVKLLPFRHELPGARVLPLRVRVEEGESLLERRLDVLGESLGRSAEGGS